MARPSLKSLAAPYVRRLAERVGLFDESPRASGPAAPATTPDAPRGHAMRIIQAAPSRWGARSVWTGDKAGDLTPDDVAAVLGRALAGFPADQAILIRQIQARDPHLASVLGTRSRAVTGLEWEIEPASSDRADRDVAAWVQQELRQMPRLQRGCAHLLEAVPAGYAGTEISWRWRGNALVPGKLLYRPTEWLRPDLDDPARFRVISPGSPFEGEPLEAMKWVVHTSQALPGWPVEAGLGRCLLWLYVYTRYGIADWAGYNERFGTPLRLGIAPEGADEADIDALETAVSEMGQDAWAVIRSGWDVKFPADTGSNTGGATYKDFLEWLDRAKSKLVVGQVLTTEAGASGTQALGNVHNQVRLDLRDDDATGLGETLTEDLIGPMVALNWGPNVPPPSWKYKIQPPEDLERKARIQKGRAEVFGLAKGLGLTVSEEQARDELGIRAPAAGEAVIGAPASPVTPATGGAPPAGLTVAETALNGAQIASLLEILAVVAAGTLSTSAAIALIRVSFPTISDARAAEIVAGALAGAAVPALPAARAVQGAVEVAMQAPACPGCGVELRASEGPSGAFESLVARGGVAVRDAWRAIVSAVARVLNVGDARAAAASAIEAAPREPLVMALAELTLRSEVLGILQARNQDRALSLPRGSPLDGGSAWSDTLGLTATAWSALVAQHLGRADDSVRYATLRLVDELVSVADAKARAQAAEAAQADARRSTGLGEVSAGLAWGRGRALEQDRQALRQPFLRYHTQGDDNVRPAHKAMANRVYPASHPIWQVFRPPNGWNCRCWVTAHTREEVLKNGWVITEDWPTVSDKEGKPVPAVPDKGFQQDFRREPDDHDFSTFPADWQRALGKPREWRKAA